MSTVMIQRFNDIIHQFELLELDNTISYKIVDEKCFIIVNKNDNVISITHLIFQIIHGQYKGVVDFDRNPEFLKQVIDALSRLFFVLQKKITNEKDKNKYLTLRFQILSKNIVNIISRQLVFFFNIYLFVCIFFISIISSIIFYDKYIELSLLKNINAIDLALAYIIVIIILLFHELGHSTASYKMNISPNEIGFGLYIIFPVFYANVTKVWIIDKYKRIIVNMGGVYFQSIFNIVFIYLYFIFQSYLILKIIYINTFIMIFSLLPFIRNDGYWVYSDIFNLPNLMEKSKINSLLKLKKDELNLPLILFGIGNTLFTIYLFYIYTIGIKSLWNDLNILINTSAEIYNLIFTILKAILFTFFLFFFIAGKLKDFYQYTKKIFRVKQLNTHIL
jgi:putative peptide zinc metalloprotease protein